MKKKKAMNHHPVISAQDAEKVAFYRKEIERITGKMVSLRSRDRYNAAMREVQKAHRLRQKERMAVLERKEKRLEKLEQA
jgi:hypothetical protein